MSLPIKSPGAAKGFSISSCSKPRESGCQRSSRLGTRRGSCCDQEAARSVPTQGTQSPSLCHAHSRTQGSARPAGATGPQPHPRHAPTASLPVAQPQQPEGMWGSDGCIWSRTTTKQMLQGAGSFLQGGRVQGLLGAQSLPSATPLLPHQAWGGWGTAIDRCNCRANTASPGSCITIMKINERLIFRAVWTLCSSRRPHQLRQPERRHHQNGGAEPPALLRTQERKQPGDMGSPKQGQRRSEASCCCWHCWGHSASRSQARLGTAGQGGSLHAFIHHIPKAAERHSRAGAVLLVTPYLQAALAKSHLT